MRTLILLIFYIINIFYYFLKENNINMKHLNLWIQQEI